MMALFESHREQIIDLCRRYGVARLDLFGSAATDRFAPAHSDLDFIVRFADPDAPGFCKAAMLDDIRKHGHVLTPGRYVGATESEAESEPFEEKITQLTILLSEQVEQATKLDALIKANLGGLGYVIG